MFEMNLQLFGGRGSGSRIGSGTSVSRLGTMSKEDRRAALDNAPVGTRISGLISKRTGNEVHVEKVEGYSRVYGGIGAGSSIKSTVWEVEGSTDPYISRTIRTAVEGTNKYYTVRGKR